MSADSNKLFLTGFPSHRHIGLWYGVTGISGQNFAGFDRLRSIPVLLLRTSESTCVLIENNVDFLSFAWTENHFERIDSVKNNEQGLQPPVFIDANFKFNWKVQASHIYQMKLKFNEAISNSVRIEVDLLDFKKILNTPMKDLQKLEFYLSVFELSYSFFCCVGSLDCFDIWVTMLKILAWSAVIPLEYLEALEHQLKELDIEDSEFLFSFFKPALFQVLYQIFERSQNHMLEAVIKSCFKKDYLVFKEEYELENSSDYFTITAYPNFVQIKDGEQKSDFTMTSSVLNTNPSDLKRMEWML